MSRTIKVEIDGKEHEVEIPKEYVLQTDLISDDELLEEALKMRGINIDIKNPTAKANDENELIKQLAEQVNALSSALQEEKRAREEATQRLLEESQKQKAKQINELLNSAIKEGKITPEQRGTWQKRLEKDFETFSETLNEIPSNPAIKGEDENNKNVPSNGTPARSGDPILDAIKEHNSTAVLETLN